MNNAAIGRPPVPQKRSVRVCAKLTREEMARVCAKADAMKLTRTNQILRAGLRALGVDVAHS